MSERDALGQFMSLQAVIPGGVAKIPPELRDAIAWAEAEKAKRRGLD